MTALRVAGIDPGGKRTSISIIDEAERDGEEGYPYRAVLVAARTWIHASTSRVDVQRDAREILAWLLEHGVHMVVMERVEHVFVDTRKGGAAASGTATGIVNAEHIRSALETLLADTAVNVSDVGVDTARARARLYSPRAKDVWRVEMAAAKAAREEDPPRQVAIGKWREPALEDLVDGWVSHEAAKFTREVGGIEHERDATIAALCALLPAELPKVVKPRKPRVRTDGAKRAAVTKEERLSERREVGCTCGPAGRHRRGCPLAGKRPAIGKRAVKRVDPLDTILFAPDVGQRMERAARQVARDELERCMGDR